MPTLTVPPNVKDAVAIRRAIEQLPPGSSVEVDLGGNTKSWVAGAVMEFGSKAGFKTFNFSNPVPDQADRAYLDGLAVKYGVAAEYSQVRPSGGREQTRMQGRLRLQGEKDWIPVSIETGERLTISRGSAAIGSWLNHEFSLRRDGTRFTFEVENEALELEVDDPDAFARVSGGAQPSLRDRLVANPPSSERPVSQGVPAPTGGAVGGNATIAEDSAPKSRKWAWVAAVIVGLIVIASLGDDETPSSTPQALSSTPTTSRPVSTTRAVATTRAPSGVTVSQRNAIRAAENYLSFTSFSRSGLIDQLEYEQYSTADATFAVDAIDVDWFEQAARKAKEYLDFTSFSRGGLIDQLKYEGFTSQQAEYGATAAGL